MTTMELTQDVGTLKARLAELDTRMADLRDAIATCNCQLPDVTGAERAALVAERRRLCEEFDVTGAERQEVERRHHEAAIVIARDEIEAANAVYQEKLAEQRAAKQALVDANEAKRRVLSYTSGVVDFEERGKILGRAEELLIVLQGKARELDQAKLALDRIKQRHIGLMVLLS